MNTLQEIQKLAAGIRDSLASLKPQGLDDIDALASERAVLREKLELLGEAEEAERARLGAAEQAAKAKQRRALLDSIAKQTEAAVANHQSLTDRAAALVAELVAVLADREKAFSREAVGLEAEEVAAVLTADEARELREAHDFMTVEGTLSKQFGGTWRESVAKVVGGDSSPPTRHLYERLAGLAPRSERLRGSGLTGVTADLASKARHLAEVQS